MSKLRLLLVPLLALLPLLTACGGYDCKDFCSDSKKCADSTTKNLDCDSACSGLDDLNDHAKCSDKWDDLMSCAGDEDDVCAQNDTSCNSKSEAWSLCLEPYCSDPGHTKECTDAVQGL